jgi:general secretion pathway protein G
MRKRSGTDQGFSLIELATALLILAVIVAVLLPLAGSLMDVNRANETFTEMARIYTAVVGDPAKNFYGYVGDTGQFPSSLMDLVEQPAGVNGWNGPYLHDAHVESGALNDPYGSPYECYYYADNTQAVTDQFAIMSRGPDRASSNSNSTPNTCISYNSGAMPSNYGSTGSDPDNVVYPRFTENAQLLKYNHLGTLAITIFNFDKNTLVNALVPGCPHLYTITVTSSLRGANDTFSMPFNPGANSVDLPQGLYTVVVTSPLVMAPLWQDQVAVTAGTTVSRTVNIYAGLNSNTTPSQFFSPTNTSGVQLTYYSFNTSIGLVTSPFTGNFSTPKACTQMFGKMNASNNQVYDTFVFPNLSSSYNRKVNANPLCTLTVLNRNTGNLAARKQVLVYDTGVLVGVVTSRGALKQKSIFNIKSGNPITIYDTTSTPLVNTTLSCGTTITVT